MFSIENKLAEKIEKALKKLGIQTYPAIVIENPKQKSFGDKSCTIAMALARQLKKNPRQIAEEIIQNLDPDPDLYQKVEIAGPGFINFYLSHSVLYNRLRTILLEKENFGRSNIGQKQKVIVEFVSANPTGPLTIGHGRQAVIGDTIARILEWNGYDVFREYYFNNAGNQMRILGDSLRLRYLELLGENITFPENYYQGDYLREIAQKLVDEKGDSLKYEENLDFFKEYAEKEIFKDIRKTLERLGIIFDNYYNEKSLYETRKIDAVVKELRGKGLVYEKDGAVWLKATELGLEQDRVIIKSSGEPTYRLPDIAYHKDKFDRGFDLLVDIFGADHIATYPDVLAAVQALGYDVSRVKVLIHQFVTLMEGENKVKMSTRKANFVTLDELMDEVGVDVTRYFFIMRSMDSHLNFDLTLARKASDENPVFYNQYAHARICSILRNADFQKNDERFPHANLERLEHEAELDLIKKLIEFPKVMLTAAKYYEPHRIPNYLTGLSETFHKFYHECQVIVDDEELKLARLALVDATRIVLQNGLSVIGISAPDKM